MKKAALRAVAAAGLLGFAPGTLPAQVLLSADGPVSAPIRAGTLPSAWDTGGPRCAEMPEWQIHEYNPDLYILRQSGCTDFEKPFVFLLFGGERALLLDTGSRRGNLAPTLQLVMHRWLSANHRDHMPLIVAHTHSHSDHVAGDTQLQALGDPDIPVTYVAPTVDATKTFYRIANWPEDVGQVDLGNRTLDIVAIPGHDIVSIAVYDRQTAILFTGDSVYPGRLYIRDLAAFEKSNQRMLRFTEGKPVAHLLGNHIEEQRTPYTDYPVKTEYQPDEHEWALSRGTLFEIQAGLAAMHGKPQRVAFRDFTLWPTGP
jgi:glyoxylase-like metal-dependent hydrolase (beta-lactamase superfamily II)